jgi:hypothetical protein
MVNSRGVRCYITANRLVRVVNLIGVRDVRAAGYGYDLENCRANCPLERVGWAQ